jgi:transcriptional regulator with XRE-family HTH domain
MIHGVMAPVTDSNMFAKLITAARGDLPMRELARRSGLSAAQISRIEAGLVETPTIETVTGLAHALERDPQLLLVALGRIDDEEAVALVLRALSQLGPSAPPGLREARKPVEQAHQRVQEVDNGRVRLLNDWQVLAGQHDVLKAESAELEEEIESLRSSVELNDDPDAIASLREDADEREWRLNVVLRDVEAIDRRGAELRREMTKCEATMLKVVARRSEVLRLAAGELFVSGATSTDRVVEALLENVANMPPGSGKSHLISRYLSSSRADDELKRIVAEVTAKSAEIEMTAEQVRTQLTERLEKSLAQTRAEFDQLTRQLRNQLVHQTGDPNFRKLAAAWSRLNPERREKVLDFIEDQRRLSVQEQVKGEEVTAITDRMARARGTKRP